MKNNAKSSITLSPEELRLVEDLKVLLKAKSKVEVVRKGLLYLKASLDRKSLQKTYQEAARAVKKSTKEELLDLDALSSDGLDKGKLADVRPK